MDQTNPRSALFGDRNRVGANLGNARQHEETTQTLMEEQNNEAIGMLSSKVDMLKQLSIDIGKETSSQNKFLDEMDNEMGSTSNLMAGTMKQLNTMLKSGGSKHMCYLVVFIFFFFLLVW
eukprot:CAMPEP_0175139692 /NCGR_PEP_ID=MMETSP0087-20121206/11052_1 /TAXON_ID=136419 /ORGANISM="Unknown Unknown, Strain D1" /LENGTH=119 /DNA_ID=CAMNT_0016422747 /DNA_START=71 /DNA_END=427 /DNA_ORIENTATION=-